VKAELIALRLTDRPGALRRRTRGGGCEEAACIIIDMPIAPTAIATEDESMRAGVVEVRSTTPALLIAGDYGGSESGRLFTHRCLGLLLSRRRILFHLS